MKISKSFRISLLILTVTLLCMAFHWVIAPLPDTAVRILGAILLIDAAVLSFCTVKTVLDAREAHR